MNLDKHIQNLLYDYDCVILPQLGGFVTNYRPAVTDAHTGYAHPPGKDILFNKNLTKSDGLLERTLADNHKISFEEAGAILHKTVEAYWSKLNGGEKVKFNRIGVLYIDDFKNLRFEPSANENFLKSSFGFDSFVLPPRIQTEQLMVVKASEEKTEKESTHMLPPVQDDKPETVYLKSNKNIYWVAAATLLPFIAMSLYLGFTTNFKSPTEITIADLNPFKTSKIEGKKYVHHPTQQHKTTSSHNDFEVNFPEATTVFPFSFENNKTDSLGVWVNLNTDRTIPAEATESIETTVGATAHKAAVSKGLYHIIGGCFAEEANADKFVKRLQSRGYNADVLDYHKNLHRVKIESFDDYSTALATLKSMRNDGTFPGAWLLKKRIS